MGHLGGILIVIVAVGLIYLMARITRKLILMYFKIDVHIALMQEQTNLLRELVKNSKQDSIKNLNQIEN